MASSTHRQESEQTPGDSEGQGSLACGSPRGHKASDTTEGLNNNQHIVSSLEHSLPLLLSQPITEKGDGDTDSFKGRKKGKKMKGGRKRGREDGRRGQIIQTKMSTTQADQRHQSLSLILFSPQTKQSRKEHNWNAPYHERCYKLMLPIQNRS